MNDTATTQRARILKVGTCVQNEDGTLTLEGWVFDCVGMSGGVEIAGTGWFGWTFEELAALAAKDRKWWEKP